MIYKLPVELLSAIEKQIDISQSKKIAECVLRLSDFYIAQPDGATPWKEEWVQTAYLAYYLPLNFLRVSKVFHEAEKFNFFAGIEKVVDFGSGLGSGSLPYLLKNTQTESLFVESSEVAHRLHQNLLRDLKISTESHRWNTSLLPQLKKTLGIFSYSLTEVKNLPSMALKWEKLMLIEPSTQEDGRKLMTLREELLDLGWHVQAPCTHAGKCPLLHQSKTDWCHDRVHVELPLWMQEVQKQLPFRNETLTFSYLLMSRSPVDTISNKARLVGDQLKEKGKTRQLVCRGEEREYLSWLDRYGEAQELSRGELIDWPKDFEKKANEIRLKNSVIKIF